MRATVFLLVFLLFSCFVYAQGEDGMPGSPRFSLQTGSSYTSFGQGGGIFSFSLAPALNWSFGERFQLVAGSVFTTNPMSASMGLNHTGTFATISQPQPHAAASAMNSQAVYVAVAYDLNDRIRLTGGSWVERNHFESGIINPQAMSFHSGGMMLGFDYNLNDRFSFGAEFQMSTGGRPHHHMFSPQMPFHWQAIPGSYGHGPFYPGQFRR